MPRQTSIKVESGSDFALGQEVELRIRGKVKVIEKRPDYGYEIDPVSESPEKDFIDVEYSDSEVTIKPSGGDFAKIAQDHEDEVG